MPGGSAFSALDLSSGQLSWSSAINQGWDSLRKHIAVDPLKVFLAHDLTEIGSAADNQFCMAMISGVGPVFADHTVPTWRRFSTNAAYGNGTGAGTHPGAYSAGSVDFTAPNWHTAYNSAMATIETWWNDHPLRMPLVVNTASLPLASRFPWCVAFSGGGAYAGPVWSNGSNWIRFDTSASVVAGSAAGRAWPFSPEWLYPKTIDPGRIVNGNMSFLETYLGAPYPWPTFANPTALPSPSTFAFCICFSTGGAYAGPVWSDGTNWRKFDDNSIVV